MELLLVIVFAGLFFGILKAAFRFAWGVTKFFFGLGLFWFCPALFVIAALFGWLGHMWIPILIFALLFGGGFRRV